jgi:glutaryl-CoA dehydrogenase
MWLYGMEGLQHQRPITNGPQWASATGELIFQDVKVPKANILPGRTGLGAPLSCSDSAVLGLYGEL